MNVGELRRALAGVDNDTEVVVRVVFEDGDGDEMGGVVYARLTHLGCGGKPVFLIEGDEEVIDEVDVQETDSPRVCTEGGECIYTADLEYDESGETINCEKCGRPPKSGTWKVANE